MSFGALLGSETRRLFARRAVRWGTLAVLAVVLLVVGIAAVRSSGSGPFDHPMRLRQLWDRSGGGAPQSLVLQMSVYVFLLVVGVAASAVGGEYRAGTMGTLLTWEPRRVRVAFARMLAVVVVAVAVVVYAIAIGAAILALLTAGVAFVTRSTVGAILTWLGYLIGIELVLGFRNRSIQSGLFMPNFGALFKGSSGRAQRSVHARRDRAKPRTAWPGTDPDHRDRPRGRRPRWFGVPAPGRRVALTFRGIRGEVPPRFDMRSNGTPESGPKSDGPPISRRVPSSLWERPV